MKLFSAVKTLNPASARNCFLMNQFATPGLGSLMGGKIIPGLGQLFLALAGFGLFILGFIRLMKNYYNVLTEEVQTASPQSKLFIAGIMLFAAAWLWSLLTSLSLMREAKIPEPPPPGTIPPRITNIPPKI